MVLPLKRGFANVTRGGVRGNQNHPVGGMRNLPIAVLHFSQNFQTIL